MAHHPPQQQQMGVPAPPRYPCARNIDPREFNTSLLGCFGHCGSCLDVSCCYCCQIGRQCDAAEGIIDNNPCCTCFTAWLLPFCIPLFACQIRSKLVARYSLTESCICTCLKGCLCSECSLCQTHRELSLRGDYPGGFCVSSRFTTDAN